jgi:hypothetical protein
MADYVLVVIKMQGCGHCTELAREWPEFEEALREYSLKPKVVMVNLKPRQKITASDGAPLALNSFLQWFPMLILVKKTEWTKATTDQNYSLLRKASVFNGEVSSGGKLEYKRVYSSLSSPDGFIKWIKETTRKSK